MDSNIKNIEMLILEERKRKNLLNMVSYHRRKAEGTNKLIIPIELQKKRGRKIKIVEVNDIINYTPIKKRGRPKKELNKL